MPPGAGMTLIQRFTVATTTAIISSRRSGDNTNIPLLVCNQPVTYIVLLESSITIPDGYITLINAVTNAAIGGNSFTGGASSILVEIDLLNGFNADFNSYQIKAKYDGYTRNPPLISLASSTSPIFFQDVFADGAIPGYLQVGSIDSSGTSTESFLNDFNLTATLNHDFSGFPTALSINSIVASTVNVSGATNASPIEITTSISHGLLTGSQVSIASVGGNTAANGINTITVTALNKFTLNGTTGNGAYTSGGVVTKESVVTTGSDHHLLVGQSLRIGGTHTSFTSGFYTIGPSNFTATTFSLSGAFQTQSSFISIANIDGNIPSVITTTTPHNLVTGDSTLINNVYGYFAELINGWRKITKIDDNNFHISNTHFVSYFPGLGENIQPSASGPVPNTSVTGGVIDFYGIIDGYGTFPISIGNAVVNNVATGVADGFDGSTFEVIGATNTTPITITTNLSHGYSTGNIVSITGVLGNTAANGVWIITNTGSTTFTLDQSVGNGNYISGGFIYSMVWPSSAGTFGIQARYRAPNDSNCFENFNSSSAFSSALKQVAINGIISSMSLTASPYIISNTTGNAVSPINVSTLLNHGLVTGDFVRVSGVIGNTATNGTFKITVLNYNISDATNASPIEITTSVSHGFLSNQTVTISDVLGNTAANGNWVITVTAADKFTLNSSVGNGVYIANTDSAVAANSFTLDGSTGNGTYVSGGIITAINGRDISDGYTSTPIQITTSTSHGLINGNTVIITGSTAPNANGTHVVTVTGANTFTLNSSIGEGSPAHYASAGIVEINTINVLRADFPNGPPGTPGSISFASITPSPAIAALGSATITNRVAKLSVSPATWTTTGLFTVQATHSPTSKVVNAATNASPIQITTSSTHGLETGHIVTISGVGGNTAANNTWTVTVINTTQFTLNGSIGNGAYTSGGTVVAAAAARQKTIQVTVN